MSDNKDKKKIHLEVVRQMLTLATSGFGLVAALAWNNFIQEVVKNYITPILPGSGVISQLIYAIVITILAVIVTMQLSKLLQRLEDK